MFPINILTTDFELTTQDADGSLLMVYAPKYQSFLFYFYSASLSVTTENGSLSHAKNAGDGLALFWLDHAVSISSQ